MPIVPTRLGDIDVTIMTKSQVAKDVVTRTIHVEVINTEILSWLLYSLRFKNSYAVIFSGIQVKRKTLIFIND